MKVCGNDHIKIILCLANACVALLIEDARDAAFVFLGSMLCGGVVTIVDAKRPSRAEAYEKVRLPGGVVCCEFLRRIYILD